MHEPCVKKPYAINDSTELSLAELWFWWHAVAPVVYKRGQSCCSSRYKGLHMPIKYDHLSSRSAQTKCRSAPSPHYSGSSLSSWASFLVHRMSWKWRQEYHGVWRKWLQKKENKGAYAGLGNIQVRVEQDAEPKERVLEISLQRAKDYHNLWLLPLISEEFSLYYTLDCQCFGCLMYSHISVENV